MNAYQKMFDFLNGFLLLILTLFLFTTLNSQQANTYSKQSPTYYVSDIILDPYIPRLEDSFILEGYIAYIKGTVTNSSLSADLYLTEKPYLEEVRSLVKHLKALEDSIDAIDNSSFGERPLLEDLKTRWYKVFSDIRSKSVKVFVFTTETDRIKELVESMNNGSKIRLEVEVPECLNPDPTEHNYDTLYWLFSH